MRTANRRARSRLAAHRQRPWAEPLEPRLLLSAVTEYGGLLGSNPNDITHDPAGNVWFISESGHVGKIDAATHAISQFFVSDYTESLTVGSDGTVWVADIGTADAASDRASVALWKFPAKGGAAIIFRFKYPGSGAQLDSHAMVMTGAGVPVFITKVNSGPASLYTPTAALDPSGKAVPLKEVGQFTPQATGTENVLGKVANEVVTGGATSPDGTKVVLRTLSDAYEWSVTNGDVVAAITGSTKPLVTPLPNESSGEGITFSADGKSFVTASGGDKAAFLRYTPSTATKTSTASSGDSGDSGSGSSTWWDKLSLEQIVYLVGAIGVIGLLMVVGGVVGIRNSRKQKRREAPATARQAGPGRASVPVPPQAGRYDQQYGDQQYGEPYGEQPYGAEQPPYGAEQQQYGSGRTYGGGQQYGSGQTYGNEQQYDPYENQYGGGTYGSEQAPQQNRGGYGGGYDPPAPRYPREEEQYQEYGAPYGQQPSRQPSQGGTYGTPRPAPPRPPAGRGYADDEDGYGDWR